MAIFRLRDENGNMVSVPALIGPPGPKPVKGEDYFTEDDKQELIDAVLAEFSNVSEVGM